MARKGINESVQKWANRVAASGPFYAAGVQSPNVDWAGPAVQAADRRNAGLQAAMADGRIDRGIQRAGNNKWRTNTVNKGVANWTQNTPKAAPAYAQGLTKVYGYFAAADQATQAMPRTTRMDRIQRAGRFQQVVGEQADAAKAGG